MAEPLSVRVPYLKKLVKAAQDMGLPVSGVVISPDGSIRIETQKAVKGDGADDALEGWMKGNG